MPTTCGLQTLRSAVFSCLVCAAFAVPDAAAAQESGGFTCNLVLGFSQVREWYETGGVFESVVDDSRWQLKWAPGAGVDRWSNMTDAAWEAETSSVCERRAANFPDRVIFGISGPFGDDREAWVDAISAAVDIIWLRYASANRVELVPVVGGPNHQTCTLGGEQVRASWQHEHIEAAIGRVVAEDATGALAAGPSPHVRSCSDYRDALGHLTEDAAAAVGRELAEHYRGH